MKCLNSGPMTFALYFVFFYREHFAKVLTFWKTAVRYLSFDDDNPNNIN